MGRSQLDCHCGGRFYRQVVKYIPAGTPNSHGYVYCHDTYEIHDITPGVATYKCSKCSCTRTQKLRVSKKERLPV